MKLLLTATLLLAAPDALDRAQRLYEQARYEDALAELGPRCSQSDVERLVACERVRAFVHIALGREDEARAAFDRLLVAAPDATLGADVSPKLHGLFNGAKRALGTVMSMSLEPVSVPERGVPWPLTVRAPDGVELRALRAHVSTSSSSGFLDVVLTERDGAWVGVFQHTEDGTPSPRYYLLATLPSGVEVALGSEAAAQPLTVRIEGSGGGLGGGDGGADPIGDPRPGDDRILGMKPWAFWSTVGGTAAILTTVVLVVALSGEPAPGALDVAIQLQD